MGARIVDKQKISLFDFRKHAVNGKLIVVLAQGTYHIVHAGTGLILPAHDRDVMVSAVHGRPHQVHGAGVHAHILLISVLLMNGLCHQGAVRPHHETSQLRAQSHIIHTGGNQNLFIDPSYAVTDCQDVIGLLVRTVGDSDAAGQIDERDMDACLLFEFNSQLKQNLCQHGIIFIGHRIAGQERMYAEMLCALFLQNLKCLANLLCGHAVFGIAGIVHDVIADFKQTARVKTAADGLRNMSQGFLQTLDMSDIVQVDDGSQLFRIGKFLRRRIVGGKHDVRTGKTACPGHHKLCHG